jgi:uncharacterized protein (DUF1330 family)
MPAYLVYICYSVSDREELEQYWEASGPTYAGQGVKVLVGYTPFEILEGDDDVQGVVVAEFPSYEACKAWFDSPGYVAARQHRIKAADYLGILVDGGTAAPDDRMPQTKQNVPA